MLRQKRGASNSSFSRLTVLRWGMSLSTTPKRNEEEEDNAEGESRQRRARRISKSFRQTLKSSLHKTEDRVIVGGGGTLCCCCYVIAVLGVNLIVAASFLAPRSGRVHLS